MLTDAKIRAAKRSERPVKLFDAGGLSWRWPPAGAAGGASSSTSRAEKNGYR